MLHTIPTHFVFRPIKKGIWVTISLLSQRVKLLFKSCNYHQASPITFVNPLRVNVYPLKFHVSFQYQRTVLLNRSSVRSNMKIFADIVALNAKQIRCQTFNILLVLLVYVFLLCISNHNSYYVPYCYTNSIIYQINYNDNIVSLLQKSMIYYSTR